MGYTYMVGKQCVKLDDKNENYALCISIQYNSW